MSLAFQGFLPFAMGFITIFVVERREPQPVWIWLLLPWVPVLGASFEGVGGVRHASFERGVLFIETVDAWEPERRLAFSIHAQSDQIPPTTLDEHVPVGGPFFDGLRGEYTLEPLPNGATRLRLSSRRRISTDSTAMLISGATPSWPICKGQSCAWFINAAKPRQVGRAWETARKRTRPNPGISSGAYPT
jgi:hypothetical protein